MKDYKKFLEGKIKLASKRGFKISDDNIHPILKPHQRDIVKWAVEGGCRAVFASFGLGKTVMQLEILRQILIKKGGKVLIVCPLGVKHEFQRDALMLNISDVQYITNTDQVNDDCDFYITNYERVRMGSINPDTFIAVTFDEASILRGLSSQTSDVVTRTFKSIEHRFVCTATPSPNKFLELCSYADYLGIMDRGQILTRFFQRDSTTAGNLTLYAKRIKEFWYWMSSWSCFITKPSDLGYDDTGYDLPPIKLIKHRISIKRGIIIDKKSKQTRLLANSSTSLIDASREKRDSLQDRIKTAIDLVQNDSDSNYLLWHHLESERKEIQKHLKDECKSVFGSQSLDEKEKRLKGFSEGAFKYLSTKPSIAGSGCNFQHFCNKAIFVGIDYKFNDFIQAVHRIYRFMQKDQVYIHVIFTDAEDDIWAALEKKWTNHLKLQNEMTDIIKEHGLNSDMYRGDLKRQMFKKRQEVKSHGFTAYNNDNVAEMSNFKDNSVDLICSSIPFGNHYEYSDNYNCFGHNESNEDFFKQMEYLTPHLHRALKPGRIAAIHVKDRIQYGYQNGKGFTSLIPFSDHTNIHFLKHGFYLIGRITITTDVVRENNQTYRLGYTEKCKDSTKMGVGLPEYILLFRKAPSDGSNAYADMPVTHSKEDYLCSRWQLDAHAYWKSSTKDLLFSTEYLKQAGLSDILKLWKGLSANEDYDFNTHQEIVKKLESMGKMPTTFMAIPPLSTNPDVWSDITRMKTLNTNQARRNQEKHICPLQLDLIERVIERYSNKDEIVLDPFGGIMSVPYQAIKMGRKGVGIELNPGYFEDGVKHCRNAESLNKQQTLF